MSGSTYEHIALDMELTGFIIIDVNFSNQGKLIEIREFELDTDYSKIALQFNNYLRYFLFNNYVSDALIPKVLNIELACFANDKADEGVNDMLINGITIDEGPKLYLKTSATSNEDNLRYKIGFDLVEKTNLRRQMKEMTFTEESKGISIQLSEENANVVGRVIQRLNIVKLPLKKEMVPIILSALFKTNAFEKTIKAVYNIFPDRDLYYMIKMDKPITFDFKDGFDLRVFSLVDLVMLPESPEDVFSLKVEVHVMVKEVVYTSGKIILNIDVLELVHMEGLCRGKVYPFKNIANGLKKMFELVRITVNEILKKGIDMPESVTEYISELKIMTEDGFAKVTVDPNI